METDSRVPVTVLTGFLGSGKTTLLNRVLTEKHGQRIAVIENEFGEVGIDHDLVVGADEEIFEMNNGCICCTVRGDLIRILGNLMKRRDRFDHVVIETTGLADPGPVAQTFIVDDELRDALRLDGIVTLVDAGHIEQHLDTSAEARQQIAFADRILLNKTDLASPNDLARIEARLRRMNAQATIVRTLQADHPAESLLAIGGFNVHRALELDPKFLEPEYPFEWGGIYSLQEGAAQLLLGSGPDPSIRVCFLPAAGSDEIAFAAARERAVQAFSNRNSATASPEKALAPDGTLNDVAAGGSGRRIPMEIPAAGLYALFTQHHPCEFDLKVAQDGAITEPLLQADFKPDHEHESDIASVGITLPGDLDMKKLTRWLQTLLAEKGPDIFRSKGVLSVRGQPRRFVFQGVHMLFDIQPDREWHDEERRNAMIFIGRNLDRTALTEGFRACLS